MLVIDCAPAFTADVEQARLEPLANAVVGGEGIGGGYELSLVITDDAGMREINRQYRGIDSATDVLSFSLLAGPSEDDPPPPDGITRLGDIVISYETARVQAGDYGHSPAQEVRELFVHGLLHILGYDHEADADAQTMAGKAEAYLAQAG